MNVEQHLTTADVVPPVYPKQRRRRFSAVVFWAQAKPVESGCWEWQRSKTRDGYGRSNFCGRALPAHRVAYILTHGEPPAGLCIMHSCDNPACINPAHLRAGTWGDNNRDCAAKGRYAVKIDRDQVEQIRRAYGMDRRWGRIMRIARRFGISHTHVRRIVSRRARTV